MADRYIARIDWQLQPGEDFAARRYSRAHRWRFDGGVEVPASASPHIVAAPWSLGSAVDPEEALVAALAACHMLFFLDLAARDGVMVKSYEDEASGVMGTGENGKMAFTSVTLRPKVLCASPPDPPLITALHRRAHELCYIANSVNFPVILEPVL